MPAGREVGHRLGEDGVGARFGETRGALQRIMSMTCGAARSQMTRDKRVEVVAPQLLALAEKIAPLIPKQGLRTPGLIRIEETGAAHHR